MAITQALDQLGPAADGIQPIFIKIDPESDTAHRGGLAVLRFREAR
jgi:cytochrome oxidase Cu insertion factor (SCO1/SenC/PrrC family)